MGGQQLNVPKRNVYCLPKNNDSPFWYPTINEQIKCEDKNDNNDVIKPKKCSAFPNKIEKDVTKSCSDNKCSFSCEGGKPNVKAATCFNGIWNVNDKVVIVCEGKTPTTPAPTPKPTTPEPSCDKKCQKKKKKEQKKKDKENNNNNNDREPVCDKKCQKKKRKNRTNRTSRKTKKIKRKTKAIKTRARMAAKRRTRRAKNSKTTRLLTTSTTTRLLLPTSQLPLKSLPLKLPLRSQRKRRTRRTWKILTKSATSTAPSPPTLAIHHMQLLPLDSQMSKQIVAILLI